MPQSNPRYLWSARALVLSVIIVSCGSPPPSAGPGPSDHDRDGGSAGPDGGTMSCALPTEGCACDATEPRFCYLEPTATGSADLLICHRGTRYCRGGAWSACESVQDYTIDTSSALITGPSAPNPCDPSYYVTTLNPSPGDLTPMNSTNATYSPSSGGITITSMTGLSVPAPCTPLTACPAGFNCGTMSNGCGGSISCGTCGGGLTCGGGGVPGRCGSAASTCVPTGCGTANCGQVDNGCGGLTASCGTCTAPEACGLGGVPSVCGVAPPPPCVGPLCSRIPTCSGGGTTRVTGIVTAPGHDPVTVCNNVTICDRRIFGICVSSHVETRCTTSNPFGAADPLNNINVYVPGTTPAAFTPGVACGSCAAPLSGNPITRTTTDIDGAFTLTGVPCGANIPLVIQLGRWRRQVVIPNVACCGTTTVDASLTHMPRTSAEGDIPRIAMVTGNVDVMECVLRKIGIADSEFTTSSGPGRVHIFYGNGEDAGGGTAAASTLWSSSTGLDPYDMMLNACEGYRHTHTQAQQQRIIDYANRGGRVFATHFNYTWLTNNPSADPASGAPAPFAQTADWRVDYGATNSTMSATIDRTFTRGDAFARWLYNRGASTTLGFVDVAVIRVDLTDTNPPGQPWLYTTWYSGGTPLRIPTHYTFDTPIGTPPASQCGRVVFSDFHVENYSGANGVNFPGTCTNGPLTPQERVLEYMLFDLASCIATPPCVPQTCADQGISCGLAADGCGATISCGGCLAPASCGGGGTPGVCGAPPCVPLTCSTPGFACGVSSNGCGGTVTCPCTTYAPTATFVQNFSSQPSPCAIDECPVWGTFHYTADLPPGTRIDFAFETSQMSTAFPSPPTAVLTVNPPAMGTSRMGTADVSALMASVSAPANRYFLRLTTTLYSDASRARAPTLQESDVGFTCVPCN